MKITKSQLKQIIKEELESALKESMEEKEPQEAKVGDYLSISMTGYVEDTIIEVFDSPPEIGHKGSYNTLQCIAQIVKIAERNPEDY